MRQVHPHRDKILKLVEDGYSYSLVAQMTGEGVTRAAVAGLVMRARRSGFATVPPSTKISAVRRVASMAKKKARLDLEEPVSVGVFGDAGCKWLHGEPSEGKTCGHPKFGPQPYCEHHCGRAFQRPNNAAA